MQNFLQVKICKRCKNKKNESEFTPVSRNKDGLHSWCADCVSEYNKSYMRGPSISFPCSKKLKAEVLNVIAHVGVDWPAFWKMKTHEIINQYPAHYKEPPKND